MKTWWEKKKSFFVGLAVGALALFIVGFTWGGWYFPGTVAKEKAATYQDGKTDAYAVVCSSLYAKAATADDMKALTDSGNYNRGVTVVKLIPTIPGLTAIDDDVASKCGTLVVDAAAKKQAAK